MIYVYIKDDEINGYSKEQINSYKFFRHDHKFERFRRYYDFPLKTQDNQRYIYPIRLTGPLVNRMFTFLPKDHIFYIPESVLADIRNNVCKLVFDYGSEPFNCTYKSKLDLADHFIRSTMHHYNLTKDQVILTTANVRAYKDTPYLVSILFAPINFIPCATAEWTALQLESIKRKSERKYKILALMRQTKPHRIKFAYDVFSNDFRRDNLITCHLPNNEIFFNRIKLIRETNNKEFFHSLPWAYDDPSDDANALLRTPVEQQMYLDSYINFVIESFIDFVPPTTAEYELDISEKTFKPISRMQPFVVYGQPGILSHLKSIGYKTFDAWWDESYDDIDDLNLRYDKVFELFKMINSKTKAELADMMCEMLPVLEHNRQTFDHCITNKTFLDEFKAVLAVAFDK